MAAWHEIEKSMIGTLTLEQLHRVRGRTTIIVNDINYDARMGQTINYLVYAKAVKVRDICNEELDKREGNKQ